MSVPLCTCWLLIVGGLEGHPTERLQPLPPSFWFSSTFAQFSPVAPTVSIKKNQDELPKRHGLPGSGLTGLCFFVFLRDLQTKLKRFIEFLPHTALFQFCQYVPDVLLPHFFRMETGLTHDMELLIQICSTCPFEQFEVADWIILSPKEVPILVPMVQLTSTKSSQEEEVSRRNDPMGR